MFGEETKIRLSLRIFLLPTLCELDIYWGIENESDYKITKGTGWLEILGCGMVDPNVLENCGINPKKYSGYVWNGDRENHYFAIYGIKDLKFVF